MKNGDFDPVDYLENEYLISNDGETLKFSHEGIDEIEYVLKMYGRDAVKEGTEFGEKIENSWIVESLTLLRIRNEIINRYNTMEEERKKMAKKEGMETPSEELKKATRISFEVNVSDQVLLFFSLANEVLQGLYGELIYKEVFQEEGRGEKSLEYAKNIDQLTQENILYHMGIVDDGLKGEMTNVRKTRNKIVHDIRKRQFLEGISNVESLVDRSLEVIDDIHEIVHGDRRFSP